MKRSRSERDENRRLGPAAAAMRKNKFNVFRDARESSDQLSAEKLFRDAADMQKFHSASGKESQARLLIYSKEELALYRQKTRADMEVKVKRGYKFLGNWIKYARWEAQQKDFARMRDVLQRAIPYHGDNPALWRDYAELEAGNGFVEEARAVFSRGVTSLPASTDLWLKYLVLEQVAASDGGGAPAASASRSGGDTATPSTAAAGEANVRDIFNRWLGVPTGAPPAAYELYALFECQHGNKMGCRDVIRRYVERYNSPEAWLFAGYTELNVFGDAERAVKVLETALEALPEELLWGPVACRVPLALADVLTSAGRIKEARQRYQELLAKVSSGGRGRGLLTVASADSPRGSPTSTSAPALSSSSPAPSFALVDDVLAAYGRFERLHADTHNYERLSRLEAQKAYERRLATDPTDFDAWVSLYLLLRDAAAATPTTAGDDDDVVGEHREVGGDVAVARKPHEWHTQALTCLSNALAAPAKRLEQNPYAAQQRAVLVMEYARVCEAAGQTEQARRALEEGIRTFPFEHASCPRLWLEAAAFEERQGNLDTARTLLSAGAKKSREDIRLGDGDGTDSAAKGKAAAGANAGSRLLFLALLRLEEHAMERGECTREAYLARIRASYQEAIRASPLDEKLWFGFARLEEKEGQYARAQGLYAACVRTITAEACKTPSYAHRYALLAVVDKTWARRIALQQKLLRKRRSEAGTAGDGEEAAAAAVVAAETDLRGLYVSLLKGVWEDYTHEALAWRTAFLDNVSSRRPHPSATPGTVVDGAVEDREGEAENGANAVEETGAAALPDDLPEALAPACARWSDAVSVVVDSIAGPVLSSPPPTRSSAPSNGEAEKSNEREAYVARVLAMRSVFATMMEEEKAVLKRTLGWDEHTSFDAAQGLAKWAELLLTPLTREWAAFEATHGASVGQQQEQQHHVAASASVATQKRRTRLLRNRP